MRHRSKALTGIVMVAASSLSLSGCDQIRAPSGNDSAPETVSLETEDEQISYAIGAQLADDMATIGFELDGAAVMAALEDHRSDTEYRMSETDRQGAISQLSLRAQQQAEAELDALKANNKTDGEAYLAANAMKDGVQVTDSGLQYKVLQQGDGETPDPTDRVTVHYHGTLTDGTVFDSSVERGQPATFGVNQVIRGWTEVLQLMQVGDKFEVVIPSELAYGERATGKIGPNATLIFEIELLDISE